jgi:hypothetical protein
MTSIEQREKRFNMKGNSIVFMSIGNIIKVLINNSLYKENITMKSERKLWGLAGLFIMAILFSAGCAEQEKSKKAEQVKPEKAEPVKVEKKVEQKAAAQGERLVLKFKAGDLTKYRSTAQIEKSLDFGGEISKDPQFQSGKTGDRVEMDFTQRIESIDKEGNARAKITINQLKYMSKERNVVNLDFDSSREKDKGDDLYKLIGLSYTIRISPKAVVLGVTGGEEINSMVQAGSLSGRAAMNLVSQEVIKKRHTIPPIEDANDSTWKVGDIWKGSKKVSFAQMGTDVFEKIYTFKAIEKKGANRIAVVEMTAIPATRGGSSSMAMNMFDSAKNYSGQLRLDLTGGKVDNYYEKLDSRWVVADPKAVEEPNKEVSTIKMGFLQLQSLERID